MSRYRSRLVAVVALLGALVYSAPARATWSIVLADEETGEVAVGTVTCLVDQDMLSIIPVVVVGKGAAAVQANGDWDGIRRPVIFDGFQAGTAPEQILQSLAQIPGHLYRQYGIVDTRGGAVTYSGSLTSAWSGGVTGSVGSVHYAIQGNVLAGACVVPAVELVVRNTQGGIPAKLMAGMEIARETGGDGRCSCSEFNPTACGCPTRAPKAGHVGVMIVARPGDVDDPACDLNGCADGSYFLRINVADQNWTHDDPVHQMRARFDAWRSRLVDRADAVTSGVSITPARIPANGVSTARMNVQLRDWRGVAAEAPIVALRVEHAPDSAGLSSITSVRNRGGGAYTVHLRAGAAAGVDRFHVTADDGIRPVRLVPPPVFEYFPLGDIDANGVVDTADLVRLLASLGPCPGPTQACPADLDGNRLVELADLLLLLGHWG